MRKVSRALIASLGLLIQFSCGPTHVVVEGPVPPPPPAPPPAEASYQSFYDALSPYGEWINDPEYGYVWMPNAGPDFKPYATNGDWVYTDDGWTWASNYPWGWAAFHYGRWFYEEGYGWMWIPGNEWAPAWVSWRQGPQYYGWAPLGPSVNVAAGAGYDPPSHYWSFVPQQYVISPHVTNYYVNEQQNVAIINNTTIINNTSVINNRVNNTRINNYAGGPDPREVSRVTGVQLHPVAVRENSAPGENHAGGAYAIYRPRINAAPQGNGDLAARPAPARVQAISNVRPVNTTIYTNTGRYNNNRGSNDGPNKPPTINNPTNTGAHNNTGIDNSKGSAVQPYSSRPGNPPAAQPIPQPGRQPGFQPGKRQDNQPGNQAASPQMTNGNNGRRNGNENGNNNAGHAPARTKPLPNQYSGGPAGRRNVTNGSNSNARPAQTNGNANGPKPRSNKGQGSPDNRPKPDSGNPQGHQ